MSELTNLDTLSCGNNNLSSLDVSKLTDLGILRCGSNKLSTLDLSKNTDLKDLDISNNQFSSIDLSNTGLAYLRCNNNQLKSLDLSKQYYLQILDCRYNYLESVTVNGYAELDIDKTVVSGEEEYASQDEDGYNWPAFGSFWLNPQNNGTALGNTIRITSLEISDKNRVITAGRKDTTSLNVTIAPENATYGVNWTSSDEKIVTVDEYGYLTGVSAGTATVTATAADDTGITVSCTVTVEDCLIGDVNNDTKINITDLMLVLNHVSGKKTLTGTAFDAADVTGDGNVDLKDLMKLLNYVSGKITKL
jgi:hypothetical protein